MEVGCPQHQAGGHKGRAWNNLTPLGISPLPLKRPWVGAGRVGAMEWEKWLMVHGGSWVWGWDSRIIGGLAVPCPVSRTLEHKRPTYSETFHGLQPTLQVRSGSLQEPSGEGKSPGMSNSCMAQSGPVTYFPVPSPTVQFCPHSLVPSPTVQFCPLTIHRVFH